MHEIVGNILYFTRVFEVFGQLCWYVSESVILACNSQSWKYAFFFEMETTGTLRFIENFLPLSGIFMPKITKDLWFYNRVSLKRFTKNKGWL